MPTLREKEIVEIAEAECVGWCTCITSIIKHLTPDLLRDYCERENFQPFPAPIKDETGVRYQYLIRTDLVTIDGKEKKLHRVAGFGAFRSYPKNTLISCLKAIANISKFHGGDPKQIVEEIVGSRAKPTKGKNSTKEEAD